MQYAFVFCESIPGLSDNVFKLPSMVHMYAGSSKSTSVIKNLTNVFFQTSQSSFSLKVLSSFFDVFDFPENKFFLNPSE